MEKKFPTPSQDCTNRHRFDVKISCMNKSWFHLSTALLSFIINNPHFAINSHHTINPKRGNFHNFHFATLFPDVRMTVTKKKKETERKLSIFPKKIKWFFLNIFTQNPSVWSHNKLDSLRHLISMDLIWFFFCTLLTEFSIIIFCLRRLNFAFN